MKTPVGRHSGRKGKRGKGGRRGEEGGKERGGGREEVTYGIHSQQLVQTTHNCLSTRGCIVCTSYLPNVV